MRRQKMWRRRRRRVKVRRKRAEETQKKDDEEVMEDMERTGEVPVCKAMEEEKGKDK